MSWSGRVGARLDAWVVGRRRRGPPLVGDAERLARLRVIAASYPEDGFLVSGPAAELREQGRRSGVVALRWSSGYAPFSPEVAEAWSAAEANRTAAATWVRAGERPGPTVIAVHGYGAGHERVEPLFWPTRRWRRAGLDVVFPTLPLHGDRAEPGRRMAPRFPAADPRFTNEGFRQAVWDLTGLIAALRARGHGPIGLAGMSLGGFTSALVATVAEELAFLVLVLPLGSLGAYAEQHGGLGPGAPELRRAVDDALRPTDPVRRAPRIAPDRVRVVAAEADGITGVAHGQRLADHFGAPLERCPGSHLVQRLPWDALVAFTRAATAR